MGKVLKIDGQDAAGQPMAGQSVRVTGCDTGTTAASGRVMFLLGDEAKTTITIGTSVAWSGSADELKAPEVFASNGSGFTRK